MILLIINPLSNRLILLQLFLFILYQQLLHKRKILFWINHLHITLDIVVDLALDIKFADLDKGMRKRITLFQTTRFHVGMFSWEFKVEESRLEDAGVYFGVIVSYNEFDCAISEYSNMFGFHLHINDHHNYWFRSS